MAQPSVIKLLERTIASIDERLVLLAPRAVPGFFRHVESDRRRHDQLLREMQEFRGRIYLHDGAITREQLTPDGRHETAEDYNSWHMLTLNRLSRVTGCAWYMQHDSSVQAEHLRLRHCPLVRMKEWGDKLWRGLESELARARREYLRYVEVGGWAVATESRRTSEGLLLALAGYSLGRICGGCLGITTATVRHCSSSILRRLGAAPLEVGGLEVPSYYDPAYKCEMEILRFDSREPNARYADLIELLREKMANVLVIALPHADPCPAFGL